MKAAVALTLCFAMLGCFPHNPKHRQYAMYAEGAALVAGIAISAVANTGADCDARDMPGPNVEDDCRSKAKILGTIGMTLILGGMLGFIATISTAEDAEQKANAVKVEQASDAKKNEPKPNVSLPPGVTPQTPAPATGNGTGSGSPAPQS